MSIYAKTRGFLRAATCQRNARRPSTHPTEGSPGTGAQTPYLLSGLPSPVRTHWHTWHTWPFCDHPQARRAELWRCVASTYSSMS
jgi:hypothetical protein